MLPGYLKLPEGFPLAKVKVPLNIRDEAQPAFRPRNDQDLLVTRARAPHTVAAMQAAIKSKPRPKPRPDDRQSDMFKSMFPEDGGGQEQGGHDQTEPPPATSETPSKTANENARPPSQTRPRRSASAEFPDWDMEV